ncbi:Protein RESTRICTED TEV MOVEMENT 2 [Morella rubra]|uniref:Protein RESTRICTED TEV MOVEMENT 2 n=1 Tax=Morella rubra TaxID=262757 RepID=A0A6A1WRS0_9ROSI|nr:Protein RESTRICTED TEV MOVEMENT 2 [Morella rubra]
MAMRQQPGGLTATVPRRFTRTAYEDFQPKFERKEEAAAYILSVHLPGFVKERIRITYVDSTRTIRAQGERPLENNRWSRFNQTYSVPENCDAAKIQSKFHQGILTVTMPKKIVEQVVTAPEEAKTTQNVPTTLPLPPPPPAPLEKIPPKRPTSTYGVENLREEKKVLQKATEDIPPKASTSTAPEYQRRKAVVEVGQSQRPPEATAEEAQKGLHAALPKDTSKVDVEKPVDKTRMKSASEIVDQRSTEKKDTVIEARGKAKKTKESDDAAEKSIVKVKEGGKKSAEPAWPESSAPKISEDMKEKRVISVANQDKRKEGIDTDQKGVGVKIALDSAKQKVKNLTRRLNEDERQLLVNVGAAVLVLVAFGAYVYFSHRSSGQAED